MYPQDGTLYNAGVNASQTTVLPVEEKGNKHPAYRWQTVSIGGVTGIVMGIAASRLSDALAANDNETEVLNEDDESNVSTTTETSAPLATEVHEAHVDQSLSFGDAFAAARAEVGSGGVFMWHGRLYNTFTAEEWQHMSDAQKSEFAEEIQPFLGQQTTEETNTVTTDIHDDGGGTTTIVDEEVETVPEVHFLGVESQEVNGQTINIGHMTSNGTHIALLDVDNDQIFDIRVIDRNHNTVIDEEDEFIDIPDREIDIETFRLLSEAEQLESTNEYLEQANNTQEDIAPEMPDYMNDADVGNV